MISMQEERYFLFDEDWNPISQSLTKVLEFCSKLTDKTGIQCCTHYGAIRECLPAVYESVIKIGDKKDT